MDKGKFSQPRPYRDEERQIEEAFRQVTGQSQKPQAYQPKYASPSEVPEETMILPQVPASEPAAEEAPEIPVTIPEPEPYFPETTEEFFPETEPEPVPEQPSTPKRPSVKDFLFPVEEPEFPEEPEEPDDGAPASYLDSFLSFCKDNRKWVLTGVFAFALVLIVSVICVFAFGGSDDTSGDTIQSRIFVAGIDLQGRTRKQAVSAVKQSAELAYPGNDMVIDLAGTKLTLSSRDTGVKLDAQAAVDAAFQLDQASPATGEARYVALLPYLKLDTDYILQALHDYATDTGSTLTQTNYGLEGDRPALNVEKFKEDSAQTLVITMGTPGISFDVDSVYDQVLDAYSMFRFSVTVDDVETTVEPDALDLQDVYEELYVEPVDSTVNMQTFEVIPGSYGYEFDLMAAQKKLEQAQYGEVIRIPMLFIEPEQIDEDSLFRDILGEFQTELINDKNRTTNIRLACEAIDGTVLEPGDTFSFNEVVGKPSSGNGYKNVLMQLGPEEEEVRGGGISQASSTLYYCVLLADLEVVSRTNHTYPVDFVDYGLDADVKYGSIDLKFRNNQNYPIRLEAEVSGNQVSVRILGTDERDYYVRMESAITATHKPDTVFEDFEYENDEGYLDGDIIQKGRNGYTVKTYKLKYDRQTGSLKSRDYETGSQYTSVDRIVASVAEPETTVPETTVPETTVPETTVPPTTAPPETTVPPTTEAPPETTIPPTTQPVPTEPSVTEAPLVETQPQETESASVVEDIPDETPEAPLSLEETQPPETAA